MYIDHAPAKNNPWSTLRIDEGYATIFESFNSEDQSKIELSDDVQQVETRRLLQMTLKAYDDLEAK